MGSGSSKGAGGDQCSLEQTTAFGQADIKANQPMEIADPESEVQNKADEKPSIFLSEDIWERLAIRMTMKEWVQISGTCKAMSRVQLQNINLESSTADAVVWAAKHSRATEHLRLQLHDWDHQKSATLSAAVEVGGWDLRKLHTLVVWMEPSLDTLWSWVARILPQQATQDTHMWLADIVSRASSVIQVDLWGENFAEPLFARSGFPPLAHLGHLRISTPLSLEFCSSIGQLPALRSICISKGPGLPDMQELPTLDFSCCIALHEVRLENVMPSMLLLCPDVEIHLSWRASQEFFRGWEHTCDRCTNLEVEESLSLWKLSGLSYQLLDMFQLPCPVLRVLTVHCKYAGVARELDLPSLGVLTIIALSGHVLLSESTCPKEVHLMVEHKLDLAAEDVAAFTAGISVLGYTECEFLTKRTQQLLKHFDDPWEWQETVDTVRGSIHHRFCRVNDRKGDYY